MNSPRKSWRSQIANGRVFELRSTSKRHPAPCALVIDETAGQYGGKNMLVAVDRVGAMHWSDRRGNPRIYVGGIRRDQFNGSRIRCRRPDLERFDADDLLLIRYGCGLDFSGRIKSTHYSDQSIPVVIPSEWTVFWLRAWAEDDHRIYQFDSRRMLDRLLRGAWHIESWGGCRHLGYQFGHAWATRHTGAQLRAIREHLYRRFPDIIEQPVRIARWSEGDKRRFTEEIRRECPALGLRACYVDTPSGSHGIYR